jgi:CDGSH-type Zn-finger protein
MPVMSNTRVIVRNDGPLRLEGENLVIHDQEGKEYNLQGRTIVSLCRCGQSQNKPFCDGSHRVIDFQDGLPLGPE